MNCPKCKTELVAELFEKNAGKTAALAPERGISLRCPNCGYANTKIFPYKARKICPKCKSDRDVVEKKDERMVTKVGFMYYCKACGFEFPSE